MRLNLHLRLVEHGLPLLFHGGDTLGHGGGGPADAVRLVEVLQHLLAHVEVGVVELGLERLGHGDGLCKEVGRLGGAVSHQRGTHLNMYLCHSVYP